MQKYILSNLNLDILNSLVYLSESTKSERWQPEALPLTDEENFEIGFVKKRLQNETILPLNEATIWGKAIFPLLISAEYRSLSAWADVQLSAAFANFILEGYVDGTISVNRAGRPVEPHLVVVEAKKGENAPSPRWQLYGAMLAAAKINWDKNKNEPQIIHGCYTIADTWVFVRGEASSIADEKPVFSVAVSREYIERIEAEIILGILKAIVAKHEQQN